MAAPKGNNYAEGNEGGRPAFFNTPEELQNKVNEYLELFPLGTRTITSLALHLGFDSRQSLYDYEKKEEFTCIIKRARLEVEASYELALYGKSATGPIFALKNMGWRDTTDITTGGEKLPSTPPLTITLPDGKPLDDYKIE